MRALRKYFLIVCEGEKTEPYYFEGFKNDLPKGVLESVTIDITGTGKNTLSLIEEVMTQRDVREQATGRRYDQVWAVFDRDNFPAQNFNNAIFKARQLRPEIYCAWSNEAFELWYLLHFDFFQNAMSRMEYQVKLEAAIKQRMGQVYKYNKRDPGLYRILKRYGSVEQAIVRAKRLHDQYHSENFAEHNPCSLVYLLVAELRKLMDE